jgi:hypothetical protein
MALAECILFSSLTRARTRENYLQANVFNGSFKPSIPECCCLFEQEKYVLYDMRHCLAGLTASPPHA